MPKIGFVLYPSFSPITLSVSTVFELTNWKVGSPVYELTLVSEHGGGVATSLGYEIQTRPFKRRAFDTIVIAAEHNVPTATPGLLSYLKSVVPRARRIASICTGAFILAEAGLLNGRRATTHWNLAKRFQQLYPQVGLEVDRIFTMVRLRIPFQAGLAARRRMLAG